MFKGWLKLRQLRDPERFQPWLLSILVRECRNLQRSGMRQGMIVSAVADRLRADDSRENDDIEALRAAMWALPEDYRLPIVLHYIEGYPVREIARILNIPERRVTDRMYRARRKLEEALKL